MLRKTKNGVFYYQFRIFGPFAGWLQYGFFPREDLEGRSLNASYEKWPAKEVNPNRERMAEVLGMSGTAVISGYQVHGTKVRKVRRPKLIQRAEDEFKNTDGFITDRSRLVLLAKVADCQAIYLVAPRQQAIGLVHAGWRGLVQNIIGKAVGEMKREFKVKPAEIYAGIGPGLCLKCSEFINREQEFPAEFRGYFKPNDRVDLKGIARGQLVAAGLKSKNIEVTRMCTKCQTDKFFSYRGEKKQMGRNAAMLAIL